MIGLGSQGRLWGQLTLRPIEVRNTKSSQVLFERTGVTGWGLGVNNLTLRLIEVDDTQSSQGGYEMTGVVGWGLGVNLH